MKLQPQCFWLSLNKHKKLSYYKQIVHQCSIAVQLYNCAALEH